MGENNRLARKQKTDGGVEGKGIQHLIMLRSISSMFSGVQGADQNAKVEGLSEESKGKLSL